MSTSHQIDRRVSRRSITSGVAWTVPVVVAVAPAPAMAASGARLLATLDSLCLPLVPEGFTAALRIVISVENVTGADVDVTMITPNVPWRRVGPFTPVTVTAGDTQQFNLLVNVRPSDGPAPAYPFVITFTIVDGGVNQTTLSIPVTVEPQACPPVGETA